MGKRINIKTLFTKISLFSILVTLTQCASSQKIENTPPVKLNDPYFQKWVSGMKGGGTGFVVYLPVDADSEVVLEKVYFKQKTIPLVRKKNQAVYVGRYTDPKTVERELIMSGDPKEEYGNTVPAIEEKIPYLLKEGECIIEYSKNGKKGHFKLDKLPEKILKAYPM